MKIAEIELKSKAKAVTNPLSEVIFDDIKRGENLLSLPATLAKVLQIIHDENSTVEDLSGVIHHDPSLTATIIRMANTPYYGRMTRCSSLSEAVMTLGSLTMKSIALTATALNPRNIEEKCGIVPDEFVANSLTVATLAREIASAINYDSAEDAFTVGLLHDIGVLYFMGNQTERYKDVVNGCLAGDSLVASERAVFGVDHMQVGEALMRRWHLPEKTCSCVGAHHYSDDNDTLKIIVQLAVAVSGDSYLPSRRKHDDDMGSVKELMGALNLSDSQLSEIVSSALSESSEVALEFGMDESSVESLMSKANKELGNYFNSLQRIMRDREELSAKILIEERRKGVTESRIAIMATLSHHINNSSMVVMGKAEGLLVGLESELSEKSFAPVSKDLHAIVESIASIKDTLEKMSRVAESDIMAVHDNTSTLDLDQLIKDSARLDKSSLPLGKNPQTCVD